MDDIKATLRDYILKNFLKGESPSKLKDKTPLQSNGLLDSLALLKLITFVEKTYSIELSAAETGVDKFNHIQDISRLVEQKRYGS